jgi:hypothetical protein
VAATSPKGGVVGLWSLMGELAGQAAAAFDNHRLTL